LNLIDIYSKLDGPPLQKDKLGNGWPISGMTFALPQYGTQIKKTVKNEQNVF